MASSSGKRKSDFMDNLPDLSESEDWQTELQSHIQLMIEGSTIDKQGGVVQRYDIKNDNSTYTIKLPARRGEMFFDIQIYKYADIKDVAASELWQQDSRRIKFVADEDSKECKLVNSLVNQIARQMRADPEKVIVPPIKRMKKL